jgi:hypothetical protein
MKMNKRKLYVVLLLTVSLLIVGIYVIVDKKQVPVIKENIAQKDSTIIRKKLLNDPHTVEQLLVIAEFCSYRLVKYSEEFLKPAISKQSNTGFDFFSRSFLTGDSLTPTKNGIYSDLLCKGNKWSVIYSDAKYKYDYCFYDTLDISIGIGYATFFDFSRMKLVTEKASGFIILFKKFKSAVFISLYGNSFVYYRITSIILLDKKLLPEKHMRYGKMGGKPPALQFVSKFVYDNSMVYMHESLYECYAPHSFSEKTVFTDIIDPVHRPFTHTIYNEKGRMLGSVTREYNDLLPWFWCGSTLYGPKPQEFIPQ